MCDVFPIRIKYKVLSRVDWTKIGHNIYKGSLTCRPRAQNLFLLNVCRETHVAGPNSGAIETLTTAMRSITYTQYIVKLHVHKKVCIANLGAYSNITVGQPCG